MYVKLKIIMTALHEKMLPEMLKALADDSRLKLLRILHTGERNVGDLAVQMDLTEPTISHHLSKLRGAGLVTLRMAGTQRFYSINVVGLNHFKSLVTTIEQLPPEEPVIKPDHDWMIGLGWAEPDLAVLREFVVNGKLTGLPHKQKKLMVILRWLATLFEVNRTYTETEVNTVLKNVDIQDYVGLRRDLVDCGYLRRERAGTRYWLTPADEAPPSAG
jgi:DNA-binding HxlR family transcriptional regulator